MNRFGQRGDAMRDARPGSKHALVVEVRDAALFDRT
jgi:hypothetical protein